LWLYLRIGDIAWVVPFTLRMDWERLWHRRWACPPYPFSGGQGVAHIRSVFAMPSGQRTFAERSQSVAASCWTARPSFWLTMCAPRGQRSKSARVCFKNRALNESTQPSCFGFLIQPPGRRARSSNSEQQFVVAIRAMIHAQAEPARVFQYSMRRHPGARSSPRRKPGSRGRVTGFRLAPE
jgi:hypothetical protein